MEQEVTELTERNGENRSDCKTRARALRLNQSGGGVPSGAYRLVQLTSFEMASCSCLARFSVFSVCSGSKKGVRAGKRLNPFRVVALSCFRDLDGLKHESARVRNREMPISL
jgi:hypothetical protein